MGDTISGQGWPDPSYFTYETIDGLLDNIAKLGWEADIARAMDDFDLDKVASLAASGPEGWRTKVDAVFGDFLGMPDPAGFDWELAEVVYSGSQINVTPGTVSAGGGSTPVGGTASLELAGTLADLNARAAQMKGVTAEAFYDKYVGKLPTLIGNISTATTGQAVVLASEQALWDLSRKNVVEIAGQAFNALFDTFPDDGGDSPWGAVLGVVGALALGVATVITDGATTPFLVASLSGIGLTTAGSLLGGSGQESAPPAIPLAASTPQGVLDNAATALTGLRKQISDQEGEVQSLAQGLLDAVGDDGLFDIASPALLRDTHASHILADKQIFLSKREIANITDLWLPDIADALDKSCTTRDAPYQGHWERGGGLGIGVTGAYPTYVALNDLISARATNTSLELLASAEHLKVAASAIGTVDEQADAQLRAQTTLLEELQIA